MDSEAPQHLVPHFTSRGFRHMPPIHASFRDGGAIVRVYESSSVEPTIWLAVEADEEVHALLTVDEAETLRDQLTHLIDNHFLLRVECPKCGEAVSQRTEHYTPSVGHMTDPDDAIQPYWTCQVDH